MKTQTILCNDPSINGCLSKNSPQIRKKRSGGHSGSLLLPKKKKEATNNLINTRISDGQKALIKL